MSKKSEAAGQSQSLVTHEMVREGHLMRHIVRNMVVNMENVLTDLQDIMGDIQSLVVQIDSVTDKIDASCGKGKKISQEEKSCRHVVKKPECVDGKTYWSRSSLDGKLYHELESASASSNFSASASNVSQISTDTNKAEVIPRRLTHTPHRIEKPKCHSNVEHWLHKAKPYYADAVDNGQRGKGDFLPDEIVKNRRSLNLEEAKGPSAYQLQAASRFSSIPMRSHKTDKTSSQLNVAVPRRSGNWLLVGSDESRVFQSLSTDSKRSFDDLSTTNSSLTTVIIHKSVDRRKSSQIRVFNANYEEKSSSADDSPTAQPTENVNANQAKVSCDKPSVILKADEIHQSRDVIGVHSLPNTPPLVKRYASPSKSLLNTSPRVFRRTYQPKLSSSTYQSLESDVDSVADTTDLRSLTPDIDWSYLNLMGTDDGRSSRVSDHFYHSIGSPVFQRRNTVPNPSMNILEFQTTPDVVHRISRRGNTPASLGRLSRIKSGDPMTNDLPTPHITFDEISDSVIVKHVRCSEVTASHDQEDVYCGYYEAVMDSILENVAGYETLEQACFALENTDGIAGPSYVCFDDQFEEDDWDAGLESEKIFVDIFSNDVSRVPFNGSDSLLSVKTFDFDLDFTRGFQTIVEDEEDSAKQSSSPSNSLQCLSTVQVPSKGSKRKLSPVHPDLAFNESMPQYDDVDFSVRDENSFTESDCVAMKATSHCRNFTLWPRPSDQGCDFSPYDNVDADDDDCFNDSDHPLTSSDEASCRAVGSGSSKMSFGSADMALSPPDDDCFATSSEADDLLLIQNEDSIISTEEEKVGRARGSSAHERVSRTQLTDGFFQTLCDACENLDPSRRNLNAVMKSPEDSDSTSKDQMSVVEGESERDQLSMVEMDSERDCTSEGEQDDVTDYNRSLNTWTAYAMVHVSAEDVSDSASDILNDNSVTCSLTSSYIDADNSGVLQANQNIANA